MAGGNDRNIPNSEPTTSKPKNKDEVNKEKKKEEVKKEEKKAERRHDDKDGEDSQVKKLAKREKALKKKVHPSLFPSCKI